MKLSPTFPVLTLLIGMASLQMTTTSCEKADADTLYVTDTLHTKDTLVTDSILTSTKWKIQEARWVRGNTPGYYLRGTSTNSGLDAERLTFQNNGTGTYIDGNGYNANFTWLRTTKPDNSVSVKWIVQYPEPSGLTTIYWDNVAYKNGALVYEEYYSNLQLNQHGRVVRLPEAKDYINVHL